MYNHMAFVQDSGGSMICYLFSKVVTMHMTHIYRHMHMLLAYTIFAINWSRFSYIIMTHSMHVCMCIYIYIYV